MTSYGSSDLATVMQTCDQYTMTSLLGVVTGAGSVGKGPDRPSFLGLFSH